MSLNIKWACLLIGLSLIVLSACAASTGTPAASQPGATQAAGSTPAGDAQPPASSTQPSRSPDGLANTRWILISQGAPGSETPVISGSAVSLEFGASGQVVGSGGCNSYGATYRVRGNGITFGQVNSTMKACADNSITQQEQQFFQALQKANTFSMKGDRMLIFYSSNGVQNVMNFVQAKNAT